MFNIPPAPSELQGVDRSALGEALLRNHRQGGYHAGLLLASLGAN
jgi:hypothetical protein